jgi:hypothetical protein
MLFRSISLSVCACALTLDGGQAFAQIQVQSPGPSSSVPVQLTATVSSCNGNGGITGFAYSVDSSPFYTMSSNKNSINASDYSILPGTHTIRYKVWTGGSSPCEERDVVTTVGNNISPTISANVDDEPNANPVGQKTNNPDQWFGVPDTSNGSCCIDGNGTTTTTYPVNNSNPVGPNLDGNGRLYYVESNAIKNSQGVYYNPGERYSIIFGTNGENFTHFVYDAYLYLGDPQNIYSIEMDTNQADASGNLYIYGLQCVDLSTGGRWQYTVNQSGSDTWASSGLSCNPQSWAPNAWHHVQLVTHRVGSTVYYDSVTLDGQTSSLGEVNGGQDTLLINFQLDAISNNGNTTTMTVYADGLSMLYW